MDTINEAKRETMNAIPNGANNLPSIPDRKNNGTNATIIMMVALMMLVLISTDASKTTINEFYL